MRGDGQQKSHHKEVNQKAIDHFQQTICIGAIGSPQNWAQGRVTRHIAWCCFFSTAARPHGKYFLCRVDFPHLVCYLQIFSASLLPIACRVILHRGNHWVLPAIRNLAGTHIRKSSFPSARARSNSSNVRSAHPCSAAQLIFIKGVWFTEYGISMQVSALVSSYLGCFSQQRFSSPWWWNSRQGRLCTSSPTKGRCHPERRGC
jgi:hypothetical protein